MKTRLISVLVALSLAISVLAIVAPVAFAVDGGCGNNVPAFRAYRYNNFDTLLGTLCPTVPTAMADIDFSDSNGAFRTSDNDKLSSWRFANSTPYTWCLEIYEHAGYSGMTVTYELAPSATLWGASSVGAFDNKASSVSAWRGSC